VFFSRVCTFQPVITAQNRFRGFKTVFFLNHWFVIYIYIMHYKPPQSRSGQWRDRTKKKKRESRLTCSAVPILLCFQFGKKQRTLNIRKTTKTKTIKKTISFCFEPFALSEGLSIEKSRTFPTPLVCPGDWVTPCISFYTE